jgi:hypothetical protein
MTTEQQQTEQNFFDVFKNQRTFKKSKPTKFKQRCDQLINNLYFDILKELKIDRVR